jgi:hypothetical protein
MMVAVNRSRMVSSGREGEYVHTRFEGFSCAWAKMTCRDDNPSSTTDRCRERLLVEVISP